jgi:phosphotransferase system HPr (HPr) family protein
LTEADIQITNRLGVHARAAAKFVHLANTFRSRIIVSKGTARVDGKSILGLLTLAAAKGTRLHLAVEGEDEEAALAALQELVSSRFEEGE